MSIYVAWVLLVIWVGYKACRFAYKAWDEWRWVCDQERSATYLASVQPVSMEDLEADMGEQERSPEFWAWAGEMNHLFFNREAPNPRRVG